RHCTVAHRILDTGQTNNVVVEDDAVSAGLEAADHVVAGVLASQCAVACQFEYQVISLAGGASQIDGIRTSGTGDEVEANATVTGNDDGVIARTAHHAVSSGTGMD